MSHVRVSCTIDDAKRIALEVVDRLLPETPHWQAARAGQFPQALKSFHPGWDESAGGTVCRIAVADPVTTTLPET